MIETSTNKISGPPNASMHLLPSPLPNTNETKLSATNRNNKKLSIDPTKAPTATNLEHTSPNKKQSINPKAVLGTNEKDLTPIADAAPTTTDDHTIGSPNREKDASIQSLPETKFSATGRNNKNVSINPNKAPTANNLEHTYPIKKTTYRS